MSDHEKTVREAALALQTAIADAIADGYRVDWPTNAAGLDRIAISETSKVTPPVTADPIKTPATFGSPSRPIEG